jgi:hypothetical protein
VLPPVSREHLNAASARLDPEDLPVLGMTLDDTPPREMAQVLGLEPSALAARIDRMVGRLKVEVPAMGRAGVT